MWTRASERYCGSTLLRLRRTRRQHFGWMFLRRGLGLAVSEDMAGVMDDRQAQCGYALRSALWVHIVPSSLHETSALRVDVSETGAGPRCIRGYGKGCDYVNSLLLRHVVVPSAMLSFELVTITEHLPTFQGHVTRVQNVQNVWPAWPDIRTLHLPTSRDRRSIGMLECRARVGQCGSSHL